MEKLSCLKKLDTWQKTGRRFYKKTGKKALKELKHRKKLLKKKFSKKNLTPKGIRFCKQLKKVLKSIQKNQEVYLGGLKAMLCVADKKLKKQ